MPTHASVRAVRESGGGGCDERGGEGGGVWGREMWDFRADGGDIRVMLCMSDKDGYYPNVANGLSNLIIDNVSI